ncbi:MULTISPECIES: NAD(P)H-binding protein [Actinomadura]|uniref:NAD(P)H-binding protein n=1 Tax=Actinomadura yumaensis TaxID=111807 RepID=A0ABW2CSC1_9ACTN|nr:NAD(P)H-binding protein [Actinomadura sp. J1-007]MWK36757.1 NAD(P)H-binding protein [Actinomadura sp. J1-007]
MFLVFGSTGGVGRHVVAGLAAAGERVRAFTRDPARASFAESGGLVEVFAGDLADPGAVHAALRGVDGVFMGTSADALDHEPTVADAVRERGVPRVVKLSSVAANTPVNDSYGRAHAASEEAFAKSGAAWTFLRPAGFMTNVLQWRRSIGGQGKVFQPYGDIARAMIDPADVAAVAVACLTASGHAERSYQLTGPEALTAPELTARIGRALGRDLEFVGVAPEQARAGMVGAGMPPDLVDGLLASMSEPGPLRGGTVTPDAERILGRAPATFDAWLTRNLDAFTTPTP